METQWIQNGQRNFGKKKNVGVCIIWFQDGLQSCDDQRLRRAGDKRASRNSELSSMKVPEARKGVLFNKGLQSNCATIFKKDRRKGGRELWPLSHTVYKQLRMDCRVVEMAQLVKCLPCNYVDLTLMASKELCAVEHACTPGTGEAKISGSLGFTGQPAWPNQ